MTHDANEKLCQFVEMTEHDYEVNNGFYAPPDCQCVLIAKVRKEMLDATVQRVTRLYTSGDNYPDWPSSFMYVDTVIEAIKGDQP